MKKPAHHGRDHRPGGEDPIPGIVLPPWAPFTPEVDDGSLDAASYGFVMVQAETDYATVAIQMRLVAGSEPGNVIINLPGTVGLASFGIIMSGLAFSSTTDAWDTPYHAYVTAAGTIKWPFGGPSNVGPSGDLPGDIMFVGGGVYPYGATWPNP